MPPTAPPDAPEARTGHVHVHERGDKRLDAVLDFVAFTARPMPLLTLLDEAPRRIAVILGADVCSLYLLEGDQSELVMRGNVGFTNGAIGQVRLRVGQGITGQAVEYMRPISTGTAEEHGAYKNFPELGEERFPSFLAVPIRGKTGPLGAIVVQRRESPFEDRDVELLSVLGGLIAAGIRTAELIDEAREKRARRAGGGTRRVTLTGRPLVVGRALGAVAALRRPPTRPSERQSSGKLGKGKLDHLGDVRLLEGAFDFITVIFITRFRQRPLHFFGFIGMSCCSLGFGLGVYLTLYKLIGHHSIGDRPLLLLALLLIIVGVQLTAIGIIGEQLAAMAGGMLGGRQSRRASTLTEPDPHEPPQPARL